MKAKIAVVLACLACFVFGWMSARSFLNCIPGPIIVRIVVDSAGIPQAQARPERGT